MRNKPRRQHSNKKSKSDSNDSGRLNSHARKVVGIHSCEECLNVRPNMVEEIWLQQGWERSETLSKFNKFAAKRRITFKEVNPKRLEELSSGHQGVAVFVSEDPVFEWTSLENTEKSMVVLLDGIVDPQNLGAMLRTSWLMGASVIFTPKDRAAGLSPTACKVASGGAEHVPIVRENNFAPILKKLKELGFWTYALAEAGSDDLYRLSLPEKVAWIVGAEGKGVRKAVMNEADSVVSIPQVATGSSYNASVSLGLVLGETYRQNLSQ